MILLKEHILSKLYINRIKLILCYNYNTVMYKYIIMFLIPIYNEVDPLFTNMRLIS